MDKKRNRSAWEWATTFEKTELPKPGETLFYFRINDFSSAEFLRGFGRSGNDHFFNLERSSSYLLGALLIPFVPFIGLYLIENVWKLIGWKSVLAYCFLVPVSLMLPIAWVEMIDMMFWPRFRVIRDAQEKSEETWRYPMHPEFSRQELGDTRHFHVLCINEDDWRELKEAPNPEPAFRQALIFLLKAPFYLAGAGIACYGAYSLLGSLHGFSINTVLLLVIIGILLVKK